METEKIRIINEKCPYGQGIFVQPNGVPLHIVEPVIYARYEYQGYSGGDCWGSEPTPYSLQQPKDHMVVLDYVLEELCPKCTYLQYRQIQNLIESDDDRVYGYYGNFDDWKVEWIILSKLEKLIESWKL